MRKAIGTPRSVFPASLAILASALICSCATSGANRGAAAARPGADKLYRVEHFRVGWYDSLKNLDAPSRLAEAGFDTVMPYTSRFTLEEALSFLRAAEAAGIGVHLEIPRARVADSTGESLEEYVRAAAGSPAVLDWYLYDEPEWKRVSRPAMLETAYRRVKALDPSRSVALVFILPALSGAYRDSMDSLWIDYYPVAQRSREFSAFRGGRYADKMKAFGRRADRYGIPLTIVPQGFGEDEDGKPQFWRRLPTPAETRYMFYASFLARPSELVYWTLYRARVGWFQDVLTPIVREFRERFPDAVEYRTAGGFRIEGGRTDSILLGNGRGEEWLLVLNRQRSIRSLEITGLEGHVFLSDDGVAIEGARYSIDPYGVLLLKTSKGQ